VTKSIFTFVDETRRKC